MKQYDVKDILKFYIDKFKFKYRNKIWFMSPKFKVKDFFDLVDEFKEIHKTIYKKIDKISLVSEINYKIDKPHIIYENCKGYFKNGIFHKVEDSIAVGDILKEFPILKIKECTF